MKSRVGVALLGLIALAGCAVFGGPGDRALRRTPSFRAGYADGCAAANGPSANPRDEPQALTDTDKIYRRGYASGYQTCQRTTIAPGDAPHPPLTGQAPVPNHY